MDRATIFERLRSFDPAGLSAGELEQRTLRLLAGDFTSAVEVHRHFAARTPPVVNEERVYRLPDPSRDPVAVADDCLDNTFDFYGEQHALGPDIDWEHNPGTDHWGHDLNRFSFLVPLVAAAQQTGEDRYARKAAALVLDWVDKNDVCHAWFWYDEPRGGGRSPYVWASYLNIAIHLRQWARHFEAMVAHWDSPELMRVIKSIHDQLAYLERVIPTMTNNWVLIGAHGMLSTAMRLPELRDLERWLDYAWQRISDEADRQVLPDGMQFELAECYHFVVLSILCEATNAYRDAGIPIPESIQQTTARMLDYLMQTITPDGRATAFNDSDPDFGPRFADLLAAEGRRRRRDDWRYVGTRGVEGRPPEVLSQAFEYGGRYVLRSGWSPQSTYLAFDGGPWGYSHQHDDRLSFWLSARGRPLLIDPGRYLYDRSNPYSADAYLKTTRAHSTITLDDQGQADRDFRDTWQPREKLTDNTWIVTDAFQRVAGSHTLGYGPGGAIQGVHRRSITCWPTDVLLVLDRLSGAGRHTVQSRLQFYPGEVVCTDGVWHTTYPDGNLAVVPFADTDFDVRVEKGRLDPTVGWYSEGVHRIEPSPTLTVEAAGDLPWRGGFLLAIYDGATPPPMSVGLDADAVRLVVGDIARTVDFEEALR